MAMVELLTWQGDADGSRREIRYPNPEVTIVLPVFRNRGTLKELYDRLRCVLESNQVPHEILFVDDACPYGSLDVLRDLARIDPRVAVLALEKNVGQQRAVMTGLGYARGEVVVVMDADLQDPPEAIPDLMAELRRGPAAVFAGRRGRYEPPMRLLSSRLFKKLLHLLCGIPTDAGLFVAMSRQMVERLLIWDDPHPFVVGMIGCTGLPVTSVPVERSERLFGRSTYSSWKRLKIGCLAIARVSVWKRRKARPAPVRRTHDASVKAYVGARFTPEKGRALGREAD